MYFISHSVYRVVWVGMLKIRKNTTQNNFDVLLTVHLSIFILVIIQLDEQNLFNSKFISCLYTFRAPRIHRQEVKIVLYSLWYHYTYRCDHIRGCIIQFWCDDTRGYII